MALFEKKVCCACGEKIGLLGNRKLEDGDLCKNCAAKLSPWFEGRRHTAVRDILWQLEYREQNVLEAAGFVPTITFGESTRVLIDEEGRRFMVTSAKDIAKANPDVIDCAVIKDCSMDVTERKSELKHKDENGKTVSYDPPRHEYEYDFYANISLDHPFIDAIRFRYNAQSLKTGEYSVHGDPPPEEGPSAGKPRRAKIAGRTWCAEYDAYVDIGEEIVNTLLLLREECWDLAEEMVAAEIERGNEGSNGEGNG